MKKQFFYKMSERTDEELHKIVNEQRNDYQSEAVEAAEKEIQERKVQREKLSKLSNVELLEFSKSVKQYATNEAPSFEALAAREEAQKRNIKIENEDEQEEYEEYEEDEEVEDVDSKWYHNWWAFMFTIAISVAVGMLIAGYIIYIIISDKIERSF